MTGAYCASALREPYTQSVSQIGDYWEADDVSFVGMPVRVERISADGRVIYIKHQNGALVRLVYEDAPEIEVGCVALLGESSLLRVEPELWEELRGVGIVRKFIDDRRVLLEGPGGLFTFRTATEVPAEVGNTVEYSLASGSLEVLDDDSLRARDRDEPQDDITRFEFTDSDNSLKYSDFGGYSHILARARHIIETQFTRSEELRAIGARPVRGVLLSGGPGTGKTYLARVIAAESDASFFLVSGPAIVSKFIGDSELVLRRIFEEARSRDRAIVFFDEIDSIASERNDGSHEASDRLVAQLLTEMDGFTQAGSNVIVMAATNRPEDVDPALRRPGRFDWEIKFELPSLEDRLAILEVDAARLRTNGELPLEQIAEDSAGWSGAELASIWTEAALLAAKDGRSSIDGEDLFMAFLTVHGTRKGKK